LPAYQCQYDVASLFFLLIIIVRYFSTRRFLSKLNTLFGIMIVAVLVDVLLEVVIAHTAMAPFLFPAWAIYLSNIMFFSLQFIIPVLMLLYLAYSAGIDPWKDLPFKDLIVLAALIVCVIVTDPLNGWTFYLTGSGSSLTYHTGPLYTVCYATCIFYLPATIALTIRSRGWLTRRQFWAIVLFVLLVMVAAAWQLTHPGVLVTGMSLVGSILLMYFNIQNPDDMLDPISGTFNYSTMVSFMEEQIRRKSQVALIAVDLSGFRRINTVYGVHAGNAVLQQVGTFLMGLGKGCWAFRMIGTRFLVMCPIDDVTDMTVQTIQKRFKGTWEASGHPVGVKASIRRFNDDQGLCKSAEDMVNLVDMSLLDKSPDDEDDTRIVSGDILETVDRRLAVEDALRAALDEEQEHGSEASPNGFRIFLQPVFRPNVGRCLDAEVLLRFSDARLGQVSPAEFIPVAEQSGLIFRIDRMVVEKACRFIEANDDLLRQHGFDRISINLSALEDYSETEAWVDEALARHSVSPERVTLEITETAAATSNGTLNDFMVSMNRRGYRFALDDFGTGYANLAQILVLPFSAVKLDRELLISRDSRMRKLFRDFLAMFGNVAFTTVVEGVETEDQAALAIDAGATRIQGFYYARPMCEDDFVGFLTAQA
jgi:EAL domain-containing protein (putative c-di-GMP-specific phosphodiesterase class I)/GGDEF domain-containing protein